METTATMPMQAPSSGGGVTIPYAIAGALITLILAVATWCFALEGRLTVAETELHHCATSDQMATLMTKVDDLKDELTRERTQDQVDKARDSKP